MKITIFLLLLLSISPAFINCANRVSGADYEAVEEGEDNGGYYGPSCRCLPEEPIEP